MKNRITATIVLSIVAIIVGMALNFNDFLMRNPASMKNLLVTFAYITIWVLVLIIGIRNKNRGIMKYCSVFLIITLFISVVTWYANVTDSIVDWIIPFAILFSGQWYGINFFVGNHLTTSIIIASISLIMFIVSVLSFRRTKQL